MYSAELAPEEKNRISHRGKALEAMKKVLKQAAGETDYENIDCQ